MTTSNSSLGALRKQAWQIVLTLKNGLDNIKLQNIGEVTFAIVMDDKIIKMTLTTKQIEETGVTALREMIVKYMQGKQNNG